MFEHIIDRLEGRFDLPRDRARTLVTWVVDQIFAGDGGGPAGFIALFRREGLARLPRSWLSEGPNEPVTARQIEEVLGASSLLGLASKVGRPVADARTAVAEILPDVIAALAVQGQLPPCPPERYRRWLAGMVTDEGEGARAEAQSVGPAESHTTRRRSGLVAALPWAMLAALLVGGVLLVPSDDPERDAMVAPAAPARGDPAPPMAAVPTDDATLEVRRRGARVTFRGVVESHATRGAILREIERAYGADAIEGELVVDHAVRMPAWHGGLPALLPRLAGRDATLTLRGDTIDLRGEIDERSRAALLAEARKLYPGYRLGGLFEVGIQ